MRSVTNALRAEDRTQMRALPASDRVTRALELGRLGLEAFRRAQAPPLSAPDAARPIERRRQAGRRPSACLRAVTA
jgi:hypothetical protein